MGRPAFPDPQLTTAGRGLAATFRSSLVLPYVRRSATLEAPADDGLAGAFDDTGGDTQSGVAESWVRHLAATGEKTVEFPAYLEWVVLVEERDADRGAHA